MPPPWNAPPRLVRHCDSSVCPPLRCNGRRCASNDARHVCPRCTRPAASGSRPTILSAHSSAAPRERRNDIRLVRQRCAFLGRPSARLLTTKDPLILERDLGKWLTAAVRSELRQFFDTAPKPQVCAGQIPMLCFRSFVRSFFQTHVGGTRQSRLPAPASRVMRDHERASAWDSRACHASLCLCVKDSAPTRRRDARQPARSLGSMRVFVASGSRR